MPAHPEGFACQQCGACCRAYVPVSEADLLRWAATYRDDILRRVSAREAFIQPLMEEERPRCPFLRRLTRRDAAVAKSVVPPTPYGRGAARSGGALLAPESRDLYDVRRDPSTPLRSAQDDERSLSTDNTTAVGRDACASTYTYAYAYVCRIHDTKPEACARFPATREDAARVGCPAVAQAVEEG